MTKCNLLQFGRQHFTGLYVALLWPKPFVKKKLATFRNPMNAAAVEGVGLKANYAIFNQCKLRSRN